MTNLTGVVPNVATAVGDCDEAAAAILLGLVRLGSKARAKEDELKIGNELLSTQQVKHYLATLRIYSVAVELCVASLAACMPAFCTQSYHLTPI